ncbi:hypothetical protein QAA18_03305 [Luteimonas sp. 8-5]|uniref:hypothetical protein n=1 Tax=Luteimonas sp. 8-5 TaxID=3039387 RepID=UPI002436701E|nr:hypothetical protein [Luteimonas sp. 8-5]MDG6347774.1 hypothetical protein [Luteimonas sp. 8-5]
MAHDIFLEHNGILRVRYSGQIGIEERRIVAERVFGSRAYDHISRFLLDYRLATHLASDPETARKTAHYLAERLRGRNARVAWLVTYDHQLAPEVEELAREFGLANRRFREYLPAIAWLQRTDTDDGAEAAEPEVMGLPSATLSPPRRALILAMEACAPFPQLPPLQFAALARILQELLDEGLDEARVQSLAARMVEMVYGLPAPRPAPSSTGRG